MYIPLLVIVAIVVVALLYSHGRAQVLSNTLTTAGGHLDDLNALQTREALRWYGQLRARDISPRIDPDDKAEAQRLLGALEGAARARIPFRAGAPTINHMLARDEVVDEAVEQESEDEHELLRQLDDREAEVKKLNDEVRELRRRLDASEVAVRDAGSVWAAALKACDDCRDCARCAGFRQGRGLRF